MTGYGRAREMRGGRDITVEVRSVNNRYLDCTVKMPRAYIFAEDAIKTRVQKAVSRGKVDVFVTIDATGADETVVSVNEALARGYYEALTRLKESFGLEGSITPDMLADLEMTLETMELGPLLGLFLQSFLIKFTMLALNIFIFVIVYGRMIEIYLLTSLAPIPVATLSNRELGAMGQNYLRSLFAVGFQGMLILVCVAIYAVLIQGIATGGDPIGAIWGCIGYTVLLCFMLMKTGTISKSIFSAH